MRMITQEKVYEGHIAGDIYILPEHNTITRLGNMQITTVQFECVIILIMLYTRSVKVMYKVQISILPEYSGWWTILK